MTPRGHLDTHRTPVCTPPSLRSVDSAVQYAELTVTEVTTGGIEVRLGDDEAPMTAFIRKSDLSRDRADQRPERFAVGDRVDVRGKRDGT